MRESNEDQEWKMVPPVLMMLAGAGCMLSVLAGFVLWVVAMGLFSSTGRVGSREHFQDVASHYAPLIEALHNYEALHGRPAPGLGDLVPEFLESLPELEPAHLEVGGHLYIPSSGWPSDPENPEWSFCVDFPSGMLDLDCPYMSYDSAWSEGDRAPRVAGFNGWVYHRE